MKTNITFIIIIIFFIICILYKINNILNKNKNINNNNNNFIDINSTTSTLPKKITFDFLTDPNYNKNILSKYYKNDNILTNNIRNVYHSQQLKKGPFFGINPYNSVTSDYLYKMYSIRI